MGDGNKFQMITKSSKSVYLQAITMINPATVWKALCAVLSFRADLVANQADLALLTKYPLPFQLIVNRGNEFLVKFKNMITNDYSIRVKVITSRNPRYMPLWKECTILAHKQ